MYKIILLSGHGDPRGGARAWRGSEPAGPPGDVRRAEVQEAHDAAARPEGAQDDPDRGAVVLEPDRYWRGRLKSGTQFW